MTKPDAIAAIDIGSDTVHLLIGSVADSEDGPLVNCIQQEGQLLLLGGRVAVKGRIGERVGLIRAERKARKHPAKHREQRIPRRVGNAERVHDGHQFTAVDEADPRQQGPEIHNECAYGDGKSGNNRMDKVSLQESDHTAGEVEFRRPAISRKRARTSDMSKVTRDVSSGARVRSPTRASVSSPACAGRMDPCSPRVIRMCSSSFR